MSHRMDGIWFSLASFAAITPLVGCSEGGDTGSGACQHLNSCVPDIDIGVCEDEFSAMSSMAESGFTDSVNECLLGDCDQIVDCAQDAVEICTPATGVNEELADAICTKVVACPDVTASQEECVEEALGNSIMSDQCFNHVSFGGQLNLPLLTCTDCLSDQGVDLLLACIADVPACEAQDTLADQLQSCTSWLMSIEGEDDGPAGPPGDALVPR